MTFKDQTKENFFTIIIPTRERSDTLTHTLKTALAQRYGQFQVLVSDNASEDGTHEKVSSINDTHLKYFNTGRRISMSENWEFALSHVDRGWVTVLGDDDAILPGALCKVNEIINKTGTNAIRSNGCGYRWPGFNGSIYGSLDLSLKRGYETRDSGQMLQRVLDGKSDYTELPVLYNGGFISIDLVKQAKEFSDKFFLSMTPDVYSAIVFSLLSDSYVYCHEPLAINGASLHSGGTAGFERVKQNRSYDPAEKFWSEENIPFHEDLHLLKSGKPVRSIQVIVYEAFLQAKNYHAFKPVKTSHAQQLKLALAKSGPDHSEIVDWATSFAQKHNLDFSRESCSKSRVNLISRAYNFIKTLPYMYSLKGVPLSPLENVADASVIAGALKVVHPSVAARIVRNFKNRIKDV
jgi:glycosyltransferase involved in cell wall biosynthesis